MSENKVIIELVAKSLSIAFSKVSTVISLFSEGATIPFIARYRKEMTGSMDEEDLLRIKEKHKELVELLDRKKTIIKAISEQGQLTKALQKQIDNCWDKSSLEDLYLPFKRKQKTKAALAKENGLEPLANEISEQRHKDIVRYAKSFLSSKVPTLEDAFQGARYILAERINENIKHRNSIRKLFEKSAIIGSKVVNKKKEEAVNYKSYFGFSEPLKSCPSHRYLAMMRGENEGLLRVKITIDNEEAERKIANYIIRDFRSIYGQEIRMAIEDALKRLMLPSIETEFRKEFKEKADKEAIAVFQNNLSQLLMNAPLGERAVLALDPGFRTGCKLVVLDRFGALLHHDTIYPNPPQNKSRESEGILLQLVNQYPVEAIAVGNGTAGKETFKFVSAIKFPIPIDTYLVNESGASIYSASALAREEFPDKDITVRGAVSIGRRLMDPMAELVKIDPKSIGVGQYQHDVHQGRLKESLQHTIESCVNSVGINLNTASSTLMFHIAGLGPVTSANIVTYRNTNGKFRKRSELLKVPKLGKKAFEQCAGFLRIKDGDEPLDSTAVHPERYKLVKKIAGDHKVTIDQMLNNQSVLNSISLEKYVSPAVGLPTLRDIMRELNKPGLDPRGEANPVAFSQSVNNIEDLNEGMVLTGVINNITKFGAFVDIGIKESGLVHISELANKFVKDPMDVVSMNQEVRVKVILIDVPNKRVSLSMKQV